MSNHLSITDREHLRNEAKNEAAKRNPYTGETNAEKETRIALAFGIIPDEELAAERAALSPEDRAKLDALPQPEEADTLPPDPEEMNDQRSAAAADTIQHFSRMHGELVRGEDMTEQNLVDLLGDIGHYCDRNGLNLSELLHMAASHYDEETNNEGPQTYSANG